MTDLADILKVENLHKNYSLSNGLRTSSSCIKAVDGVSFSIGRGATMGLVGESGCGKTTLGRTILRLTEKNSGRIFFDGIDIHTLSKKQFNAMRPKMQLIFQNPYSSLSPRMTVNEIIGEAVKEHQIIEKNEYDDYICHIMETCGLSPQYRNRYPHQFSGGQRQRIGIARALALRPSFVICDEAVSALDVSMQAQIINLLIDNQQQYALTYLFISHDLAVVEHIADTIGVMYMGQLVELGTKEDIFSNPLHPYTKALMAAIPVADPSKRNHTPLLTANQVNNHSNCGCKYQDCCNNCREICRNTIPRQVEATDGHFLLCHFG